MTLKHLLAILGLISIGCTVPHRATPWIPFELSRNQILLQVKIEGTQLRGELDSGSTVSVIRGDTAKGLALKRTGQTLVKTINRSAVLPYVLQVPIELEGAQLVLPRVLLSQDEGRPDRPDIILDNRLFREAVVELDYPRKRIRIHNSGFRYTGTGSSLQLRERHSLLYTTIEVDGRSVEVLVDTGNAAQTQICDEREIPANQNAVNAPQRNDVFGRIIPEGVIWTASSFGVGKYVFVDVPVSRFPGCKSNIGYLILSQFDRVIFDALAHRIYFEKFRKVN